MRFLKPLLAAACTLAILASVAVASDDGIESEVGTETPQAIQAPHAIETSAGVTTFSDGVKVYEVAAYSDCPNGWVCIWEHANYGGRMLQFQDRGYWQNLTAYGFNDQASSWRNRINQDARLAEHINGGGRRICMQPNSANPQLAWFNDLASSIRLYKTSTVC